MSAPESRSYGPYRVIRTLGSGGMGTVLLAEDPRLGRFVALKTFPRDAGRTSESREVALREARAVAGLNHPNIASVHDVLDIGGELVIVFEYVEGETLATRLDRGRLPVVEAIRIGAEIADGLAAAHARGIIHRDLKPGNVMLTPDGRAKILDFGIARAGPASEGMTTLTTTSHVFAGTPAYAAPEQWLGDAVTPQTDLFAFGMLLFEMFGGRRPFDADSRLAMMQLVLDAPRPNIRDVNPHVPPSVDALIGAALSRDPHQRPASAMEVASVLRSIARDLPPVGFEVRGSGFDVQGSTIHGSNVLARQAARRRGMLAAAIALTAAVVALLAPLRRDVAAPIGAVPVIAVLPLANATGTPTNDYIAAGVAESLTTSLASLQGVTMISRAAVVSAANRDPEPAAIARELGARYLVEGSVQLSGNRVKLGVNLVRPDRSVVWAESVEGLFDDIFSLQSRLAAALARALSVQLSAADRAKLAQQPTANPNALAAYYRGRALLERRDVRGNTEGALAAFNDAVTLDPNFAVAHAALGETYWSRYVETRDSADAERAVSAGTTALRLNPTSPEVRYTLAVTLAGTGQLDAAVAELQHALALRSNFEDARVQLGRVLARQSKIDEAIAEFRKVSDARPDFAIPYSAAGVALFESGRYREAAQAFERVTQLQPDNVVAHQQVGVASQALGDSERALASYQRALAIRPYAPAYSNIGAVYHERGEYAKAIEAYKQALAIRPLARETHRNIGDAYLKLGLTKDALRAYERAIELTRNDLKVDPRNARILSSLALYLQKANRTAEALEPLTAALRIAPQDFEVLRRAAAVHALAGRTTAALDALDLALQHGLSRESAEKEDEFESLRGSTRFKLLVTAKTPRS
jgi:tetratricopeptide (TPR) repeat protein